MSERLCRLIFCRRSLFDVNIPFAPSLCRPFLRPRPRSNKLYDTTVLWIRSPFFVWTYGSNTQWTQYGIFPNRSVYSQYLAFCKFLFVFLLMFTVLFTIFYSLKKIFSLFRHHLEFRYVVWILLWYVLLLKSVSVNSERKGTLVGIESSDLWPRFVEDPPLEPKCFRILLQEGRTTDLVPCLFSCLSMSLIKTKRIVVYRSGKSQVLYGPSEGLVSLPSFLVNQSHMIDSICFLGVTIVVEPRPSTY